MNPNSETVKLSARRVEIRGLLALALLLAAGTRILTAGESDQPGRRPYRVLVIVGDQWNDPGSYNIDGQGRYGGRTRESDKDFRDVITMLKIWGIPFDILRLDQQRLQINRLLNGWTSKGFKSTGC
jgi:hypothetical protein